jgi:hypothetical protein
MQRIVKRNHAAQDKAGRYMFLLAAGGLDRLHAQYEAACMPHDELARLVLGYRSDPTQDNLTRLLQQTESATQKAVWCNFSPRHPDFDIALNVGRLAQHYAITGTGPKGLAWQPDSGRTVRSWIAYVIEHRLIDLCRGRQESERRHEVTSCWTGGEDAELLSGDILIDHALSAAVSGGNEAIAIIAAEMGVSPVPSAEDQVEQAELAEKANGYINELQDVASPSLVNGVRKGYTRSIDRALRAHPPTFN